MIKSFVFNHSFVYFLKVMLVFFFKNTKQESILRSNLGVINLSFLEMKNQNRINKTIEGIMNFFFGMRAIDLLMSLAYIF